MYDVAQDEANHKVKSKQAVITRSSKKLLLKTRRPRTEKFKKSLAYRGPKSWNALPAEFHLAQTKVKYKSLITNRVNSKAAIDENLENSLSVSRIGI